jgi:GNAT superfamily N-acetyltransferase
MIRAYTPADEDAVIAVWLAATIPGQAFLPEQFWRDQEPEIRELLPAADLWVVEDDHGPIVAFVSVLDDMVGGLFTHPDHQGRGYGRALIALASRLHDPLFVEVFEANTRARRFYRRCGFVDHGRHVEETSGLPALTLRLDRTSRT